MSTYNSMPVLGKTVLHDWEGAAHCSVYQCVAYQNYAAGQAIGQAILSR